MPQLDFTLWVINCITNWSIIFIVLLMLNSSVMLAINDIKNSHSNNDTNSNSLNNWPW